MMLEALHVRLGEMTVAVHAACPTVTMLSEFYPPATDATAAAWTVTALTGASPPHAIRNPFGVGVTVDVPAGTVALWSPDATHLAITTRKIVRELFLDACERRRYTMLHASAIYRDDQVVVFAADKRGGKTTLAVRAVLDHGWRWLANDHLIVFSGPAGLVATSLPSPIPVKVGTLVDLADQLPEPWDRNGVDVDWWRAQPDAVRYASDDAAYFTFARFGQPNPVLVELADRRVTVVFPRYASSGISRSMPCLLPPTMAGAELATHVRTDWIDDPQVHQRQVPLPRRDRDAYVADGTRLATAIGQRAQAMRWAHHGDPTLLLATLTAALGGSR
jgi:hypothetical protein